MSTVLVSAQGIGKHYPLVSRRDVVIVASVSSIYGLGSPDDYKKLIVGLHKGDNMRRDHLLLKLVDVLYERNDINFERGKFRVRGDSIELWPTYEEYAYRIEMWGDEIEQISIINPLSGEIIQGLDYVYIYPAKHFVLPEERIHNAVDVEQAQRELAAQHVEFRAIGDKVDRLAAAQNFHAMNVKVALVGHPVQRERALFHQVLRAVDPHRAVEIRTHYARFQAMLPVIEQADRAIGDQRFLKLCRNHPVGCRIIKDHIASSDR